MAEGMGPTQSKMNLELDAERSLIEGIVDLRNAHADHRCEALLK
jgi:hypothetical protein